MKINFVLLSLIFIFCCSYKCLAQEDLDSSDLVAYKKIVSDSSLAPRWFKMRTEKSLKAVLGNDEMRRGFWESSLLCIPVRRLFAFLPLVIIIFFIVSRIKRDAWEIGCLGYLIFILFPFLLAFITGLLTWLLNLLIFAFTGGNSYFPFEFIYFLLLGVFILFTIVICVEPLYNVMMYSANNFNKALGFLGLTLNIIGLLFTILEIFRRLGYPLDGN